MSTLAYIIISAAVVLLKLFLEQKNKDSAPSPTQGEILTEVFPTLSDDPDSQAAPLPIEEQPQRAEVQQPAANIVQALQQKRHSSPTTHHGQKGEHTTTPPQSQQTAQEQDAKSKRMTLTKREEARRAFIYSEIFNRKYE